MTKTGNPIYRPVKRRTVLRGMAAAGGFVATAPYIGTSHAAGEDINIGVTVTVRIEPPGAIERSIGKAKRVIDKRRR